MSVTKGTGNLMNLAKHFSDEDSARQLLEQMRWPDGPVCPHCGGDNPYILKPTAEAKKRSVKPGTYKCRACRKQFTVRVGTIFEASHVPLATWLFAIHLMSASKKGYSALQLARTLDVTYKTAWFICHRLRKAMETPALAAKLTGVVESDETYVGARRKRGTKRGRPGPDSHKTPVVALVERGGKIRAFPVERVTAENLGKAMRQHIDPSAVLMTDELPVYRRLGKGFAGHETVNHLAGEYVSGRSHVNTAEGFFGLLKRGVNGTFHHISKHHMARYCHEFEFRYNLRHTSDGERAAALVQASEGRRLTYRPLKKAVDSLVE